MVFVWSAADRLSGLIIKQSLTDAWPVFNESHPSNMSNSMETFLQVRGTKGNTETFYSTCRNVMFVCDSP